MEVQLSRTAFGPGDSISCTCTLTGNPDWPAKVKKVRAEKLSLWVEQTVTYFTSGEVSQQKVKRIAETRFDFGGLKLLTRPLAQRLVCAFPREDQRDKDGLVKTTDTLLPKGAIFTTKSKLYEVAFAIHVRATFKGAKDIAATVPMVASHYSLADSKVILDNIESAVYEAAEIQLVSGLCGPPGIIRKGDNFGDGPAGKRNTVFIE